MDEQMLRIEAIKRHADFQRDWRSVIEPLKRGKYTVESTESLSIHGDAPKCFIKISEYRPGQSSRRSRQGVAYIAKVGSKFYPIESITEHLFTRLGQLLGINIADSMLRFVGQQVRFLSKFFRGPKERLVHGVEIFKEHLDQELVEEIAARKVEREFYTFQIVREAMKGSFPDHYSELMSRFVEMLAFDAVVGNNDRHPANWGIIVPLSTRLTPRFAPIYDTARGLFWNRTEEHIRRMLADEQSLSAYVNRSVPQIGWDGASGLNHFDLIQAIHGTFELYRPGLSKFSQATFPAEAARMIESEFGLLLSPERRALIARCLKQRMSRFMTIVG